MTRKYIIPAIFIFMSGLIFPQQKNVLFIMVDDFNHWVKDIGYNTQSITPNIDRLASRGILFTDAHCSSPVCNPSRNALWSGLRPSTTGISANSDGYVRDKAGFHDVETMNQYFMNNGYYTYGIGKLYHKGRMGDYTTDPDNWSDINTHGTGSWGGDYYHWESPSAGEGGLWNWGGGIFDEEANANDRKVARIVADLITNYSSSGNSNKPFFIGAGLFRPHLPWKVHKDWFDMFDPDTLQIPIGYLEGDLSDIPGASNQTVFDEIVADSVWLDAIRAYLACMAFADHNVGIILDALENSQYNDNTIVCFMGDHGWHLGEKNRFSKYAVYDQANHTTLIIYDPLAGGNGKLCKKVVSLQDIYPTLIDLTGLPERERIEGVSLKPLLQDPERSDWNKPVLSTYSGTNYIKTNQWKFVDDGSSSQLYNVVDDPHEWYNLYSDSEYSTIISNLRGEIDSIVSIGTDIRKYYQSIPDIKFKDPVNGQVFPIDIDLNIEVDVTVSIGSLEKAELYLNSNMIGPLEGEPFIWNSKDHSELQQLSEGDYEIIIKAYNTTGRIGEKVINISVSKNALPAEYRGRDIGEPDNPGSSVFNENKISITSYGNTESLFRDEFYYVYRELTGDSYVSSYIESFSGAGSNGKSGLMIRESLEENSKYAFLGFLKNNGSVFDYRETHGWIASSLPNQLSYSLPCWVKLERIGNNFTAYLSADGENWLEVANKTIEMEDTVHAGFALSSNDETFVTSLFSNFRFESITEVKEDGRKLPESYFLSQNYPNPFNPRTEIRFGLPKKDNIKLILYNSLGEKIKTIYDDLLTTGSYSVSLDASALSSGIYYYSLHSTDFSKTKKMVILK